MYDGRGVPRHEFYPLLRRAVNTYLHQLAKDGQGVYHIPEGHSPKPFPERTPTTIWRRWAWGCKTLLRITKRLGIEDELASRWKDVLDHLTPYPQDETGTWAVPATPHRAGTGTGRT